MTDTSTVAFLVTVYGTVQGVGFRATVRKIARQHQVFGWVRNRRAGHVQCHFEGPQQRVRQVLADLQMLEADITDCVISKATPCSYVSFQIVKTSDSALMADVLLNAGLERASVLALEYVDLERQFREIMAHIAQSRADDLKHLAQEIPSRFLGEPLVQRQKILPFAIGEVACSFAGESWSQRLINKAMSASGVRSAEALIDDKANGKILAQLLGLRVPETYQNGVALETVEARAGIVVKPSSAASSKGVYCFLSENDILNVGARQHLPSAETFFQSAQSITASLRRGNDWIVEELILGKDRNLPNDMKFYCFYGHVPILLEVDRKGTSFSYCWWRNDGTAINTGKYDGDLFIGHPPDQEYFKLAEEVSKKIPIPFMRLDFLKSDKGPVFGEFTPKPGNFHGFNAQTDSWLGRCYAEAKGRLIADLRKGKVFSEYDAFLVASKNAKTEIGRG